jgi:hypothetical protein
MKDRKMKNLLMAAGLIVALMVGLAVWGQEQTIPRGCCKFHNLNINTD